MQSYTSDTAEPVPRVSFGSSGLLSTQIFNGAPFEVFLSADLASVQRLPDFLLKNPPQVYATGALSLVVPDTSSLSPSLSLDTLAAAILEQGDEGNLRIAIPNPVHAPYGRAARDALVSAGVWPMPDRLLLTAENAAQTLQFIKSGAVSAAIVPRALIHANDIAGQSVVDLPAGSYQPVEHFIALLTNASESAQAFHQWLLGDKGQQILLDSGLQVANK